ncbi:hypothetical protein RJZ57_000916 [Blastomyces gilchristii]
MSLPDKFASIPRQPRITTNNNNKREDLNSALAYGGNKTRKLEYLVADAVDQRCDTLVSIGGPKQPYPAGSRGSCARGSTHPEHWVDWEYPGYETVGNIRLSRLMGAGCAS